MRAPLTYRQASRLQPQVEARALAAAEGQHPEVILALLAAAVLLMVGPVLVVGLSTLDSQLLAGARDWLQAISTWLSYLTHAAPALALPMAAFVARSSEDV